MKRILFLILLMIAASAEDDSSSSSTCCVGAQHGSVSVCETTFHSGWFVHYVCISGVHIGGTEVCQACVPGITSQGIIVLLTSIVIFVCVCIGSCVLCCYFCSRRPSHRIFMSTAADPSEDDNEATPLV